MLEIKNLTVHYDGAMALNDVNLEVKDGEFVGVVGPNGAGKTTLLRAISGVLMEVEPGKKEHPSLLGTITFDGKRIDKLKAWKKLKFNIMFVGDDWYESVKWKKIEGQLEKVGVKIVYFPYTKGTSSTMINQILVETREEIQAKKERLKKLLDEKGKDMDLTEEDIKLLFS